MKIYSVLRYQQHKISYCSFNVLVHSQATPIQCVWPVINTDISFKWWCICSFGGNSWQFYIYVYFVLFWQFSYFFLMKQTLYNRTWYITRGVTQWHLHVVTQLCIHHVIANSYSKHEYYENSSARCYLINPFSHIYNIYFNC